MGRPDIVLIQRGPGRPAQVLLFEFKREPAAGTTPLKELAQEAYTQAEQKYLEGAQEKWNPEKIIIYGVGFRGKALALEAGGGDAPHTVLSVGLAPYTALKKAAFHERRGDSQGGPPP